MKKIILLLFLPIYLILNLGISIKLHYCGNAIHSIDFSSVASSTCCGEDKKPSCCKDKIAHLNSETTQDTTPLVKFLFPDYAKFNLAFQDFSFQSNRESKQTDTHCTNCLSKKFPLKVPLYLNNRVLLL